MEILHCITTIQMGGAEKQLLTLVNEQIKLGLKVTIIYLKGEPELKKEFQKSGAVVIDYLANKNVLFQVLWMKKYLKSKKIIVHAHLSRSELFCAMCKADNYLVITKHNAERFFPKAPYLISKKLARFVFFRADFCISISFAVEKYLQEISEIVKSHKTKVIHYGASMNSQTSSRELNSLKSLHGIKKHFVLGTIARLVPQKNLGILIKAFASYHKENNKSILILIGDGPLKSELHKLAKQLNVESQIIWISRTEKIPQYLSILDVFILPSNYEGFGLVLLEAMQAGTAILAANNSAIPEVMGRNYPGLYPTNQVHKLVEIIAACENQSFRKKLCGRYQSQLSKFNSANMAEKVTACYRG